MENAHAQLRSLKARIFVGVKGIPIIMQKSLMRMSLVGLKIVAMKIIITVIKI